MDYEDQGFGVSHLSTTPITVSFGFALLLTLVVLVVLRLVFGDVSVRAGGGVK